MILGQHNLNEYAQALSRGLDEMVRLMAEVQQPFSGIEPGELARRFEAVDLDGGPLALEQALAELHALYLEDAVYFHHPKYLAHMNCPITVPSLLAELIAATINSSLDTWDQSAGATLIEQALIDWTARRIELGPQADGIFTSGGTQSNLMALLLARDNFCANRLGHNVRDDGLPTQHPKLRIFASEVSHFSVTKAASVLGLGRSAVLMVPCDSLYRMDVSALSAAVEASRASGELPMAVVATAGTTDFGSIDPLAQLGELCADLGLWLHTDATYGCGLLVSPNQRWRLNGIEQSDSVAVDYHKSFFQPVSCSALLVRERLSLSCLAHHADYLNPAPDEGPWVPNHVDKSLQTTRRFDALKLWLTLRMMGAEAIGFAFERVIELAGQAYEMLTEDPEMQPLHKPELSTLVFRHAPPGLDQDSLDRLNTSIRWQMTRDGQSLLGSTRVKGRVHLKITILNPSTKPEHIREVLAEIKTQGHRLKGVALA